MAQFSNGINDQYLDRNGLDYLLQELDKKYSDGGNVDLSNYYTKSQVDTLLSSIGEGKNGVGIQSVTLVNYELIVTLTDTTVINLGNVRGAQGIQGVKGDTGEKGADGTNGLNGTDGTNGSDGRGLVSIIKTGTVDLVDTYTITYTDNTTSTFTVTNGSGGTGGSGSSIDTYSTDETAIGTWIDGSTIYRKVVSLGVLPTFTGNNFARISPTIATGITNFVQIRAMLHLSATWITMGSSYFNIAPSPNTTISSYVASVEKAKITIIGGNNVVNFYYGADWAGYTAYVIVDYLK